MEDQNNELSTQSYDSISDDEIAMEEINAPETDSNTTSEGETEGTGETVTETPTSETTPPTEDNTIEVGELSTNPQGEPEDRGTPTDTGSDTDIDTSPSNEGDSSPVTPFASLLHEKGVLPNFNSEEFGKADNKIEALMEAIGREIGYANNRFIQSFPPELIEAAKAVSEGIPYQDIQKSVIKEIEYNNVTEEQLEEDESLQKRLVSDFLTSKGFSEKKITGLLDTYEDSGKLKSEATDSLQELKVLAKEYQKQVKEHYAKQQQVFEAQHKEKMNHIQTTIDSTEEIIPGKSLTQIERDKLYQNMTQIAGKDTEGNPIPFTMVLRQKDPLKFDMAVTYLADITKAFTDFSAISKSAKSTALKDLENTLDSNTTHLGGTPKTAPGSASESELISSLQTMFKSGKL